MRIGESSVEIFGDIFQNIVFENQAGAFVMKIKTAEVEIDRSYCRDVAVGLHHFGVNKARRIFVDVNACFQQLRIIGLSDEIDRLLVRNIRQENPHVNSAFCRALQGIEHFII